MSPYKSAVVDMEDILPKDTLFINLMDHNSQMKSFLITDRLMIYFGDRQRYRPFMEISLGRYTGTFKD